MKKRSTAVRPRGGRNDEDELESENGDRDDDVGEFHCSQCGRKFVTLIAKVTHFSKQHLRHGVRRIGTISSLKRDKKTSRNSSSVRSSVPDVEVISVEEETADSRCVFHH